MDNFLIIFIDIILQNNYLNINYKYIMYMILEIRNLYYIMKLKIYIIYKFIF